MKTISALLIGMFLASFLTSTFGQMTSLSEVEKRDILYMLEEEKLARDVYIALGDKWDVQVFKNIAKSETQHFSWMNEMAKNHNLEIPRTVISDKKGQFKNQDLQALYDEFIRTGNLSLIDALKVGARIEEIDIKDLDQALANTDIGEMTTLYTRLQKASENHLRAFARNLEKEGVVYLPTNLSKKRFDGLLSAQSNKGNCCLDGKKAHCKGNSGGTQCACSSENKVQNKKGKGRRGKRS